jgi:hypothetical protein
LVVIEVVLGLGRYGLTASLLQMRAVKANLHLTRNKEEAAHGGLSIDMLVRMSVPSPVHP